MADNPRPSSADILTRYNAIRQELTKLQQDAMTREASLKGEINSLKEELEQVQNNAQLLDAHVSGLQEELSQLKAQNAQLIRSLPSRDVRYTHALKVIKDLLAERRSNGDEIDPALLEGVRREAREALARPRSNPSSDTSSRRTTTRPLPSPAPSFDEGSARDTNRPPSDSSLFRQDVSVQSREIIVTDTEDDDQPVRQPLPRSHSQGPSHRSPSPVEDMENGGGTSYAVSRLADALVMQTFHDSPTTISSNEIVLRRRSSVKGPANTVYWEEPPACSPYVLGPYSWRDIQSRLRLSNEQLNKIQRLEHFPEFGFTIHFDDFSNSGSRKSILAFLHRPLFYEHGDRTHLVSWAKGKMHNDDLALCRRYTGRHANGEKPVVHVFSSLDPMGAVSKEWWYLSAMKWKVVELPSIWDKMDDQRGKLVDELSKRYKEPTNESEIAEEIAEDLASGELRQLTVEMTAVSVDYSEHFAREVLGAELAP